MHFIETEVRKNFTDDDVHRLFHGRGHCFPGYEDLLIDWFSPVVFITLYRQRDELWLTQLANLLRSIIVETEGIILQERFLKGSPSRILSGRIPAEVNALEAGLKYRLRLNGSQNIGFFPDMFQGRRLVETLAANKTVLNLFAYSCSFSVAAIAAGAKHVVNLDMNRGALDLGRINHQINDLDLRKASFMPLELFRSFSKLKKLAPFDVIICDPPADQGRNFQPQRDWPKLIRKLPTLSQSGGDILICASSPHLFPGYLQQLMLELFPQAELFNILHAGEEFPELDQEKGLSILHYKTV
ncbi:23S rRNA (cytosine1962-C5)-methyltransferase [Desulfuromusa kysingii]|uniref:23S rRNA (Cytosine1962-C5)-methyltransferase n=1 Tax=Desulfuromusa kysingii TaxID=37625 RepID=A0A1H3YR65_9BACT|nr:class I SAM-dependent methyltransferase [Desulfuromusa kysingii]SEA13867.1 23S rRNA (cytosine1962-C5)-methyltransferase [Desulfuromusa kysingii]